MLQNYFKSSFRNLVKNKLFSTVNIFGLSISLAAFGLVFLFVFSESNYDSWVKDADKIFRLNATSFKQDGSTDISSTAPSRLSRPMSEDIRGIDEFVRLGLGFPRADIKSDKLRSSDYIWKADANLFTFFGFDFIDGNPEQVLAGGSLVVISKDMAIKYFGTQNAVGQTLTIQPSWAGVKRPIQDFRVAGVFEFPTTQSHFKLDIVVGLDSQKADDANSKWYERVGITTFVKLADGIQSSDIESQLPALVDKHIKPKHTDKSSDELVLELENLKDLHLSKVSAWQFRKRGNTVTLYVLSSVAVLILVIACINFSNLQVSRSVERLKEMSIRQIHGASRPQVIGHLIFENMGILLVSFLLGFACIHFALPFFNEYMGKVYSFESLSWGWLVGAIVILSVLIGVITSLYPAAVILKQRPSDVLRSTGSGLKIPSLGWAQDVFLMVQLVIVIVLIISTIVISAQVKHAQFTTDLGFNPENKLSIPDFLRGEVSKKEDVITKQLLEIDGVTDVAFSGVGYGWGGTWMGFASIEPIPNSDNIKLDFPGISVSKNFLDVYEETFVAGRSFSPDHVNEVFTFKADVPFSVILNEEAVKRLGFKSPADAIGKQLWLRKKHTPTIIGVTKNHPVMSFKEGIKPYMYIYMKNWYANIATLQYAEGADTKQIIKQANLVWDQYHPDRTMDYNFVTDNIAWQYKDDLRQAELLGGFAALAIIIASLGAFSLAVYTVKKRALEVSIRKIHGANGFNILSLFFIRFSKPTLIASIIAWPIAYYLATDYLAAFSSRIDLQMSTFVLASVIVLICILIAVLSQVIRVMLVRPVDIMRQE